MTYFLQNIDEKKSERIRDLLRMLYINRHFTYLLTYLLRSITIAILRIY